MFHADTHFLIDYWTDKARQPCVCAGIPYRNTLHADAMGPRLSRLFMVEIQAGIPVFRVCGGWIESFHGKPLKSAPLETVWNPASHPMIAAALSQCIQEARPVVVKAAVGLSGDMIEVTLAPLRGSSGQADQVVGLYAPMSTLALGEGDSRLLTGRLCAGVGSTGRPNISLATVHGRRTA